MTTHDQHTSTRSAEDLENPRATTDPSLEQVSDPGPDGDQYIAPVEQPAVQTQSSAPRPESAVVSAEPSSERAATPEVDVTDDATDTSPERELFADDELSRLRARWDNVQASFVDDPRECVQKADGLVSDVVDQLTAGFSQARSRLEEQWARGEEASTEDLRVALKQYREFFQRLLAV